MRMRTSYSLQCLGFAPVKANIGIQCIIKMEPVPKRWKRKRCGVTSKSYFLVCRQRSSSLLHEAAALPVRGCGVGAAGFRESAEQLGLIFV